MAISTYAELVAAAQTRMVYDDISAEVDNLLDLAEAKLNREVRIREMETTETYSSHTTQTMTLPAAFSEAKVLYETGESGGVLEFVPERMFWSGKGARAGTSGQPAFYTITGETVTLDRTPDAAREYKLDYYAEVTGLSSSNTTNVILTKAPDLYLWALLEQAAIMVGDENLEAKYAKNYANCLFSLHGSDARGQSRPGPRMRSRNTRDGYRRLA